MKVSVGVDTQRRRLLVAYLTFGRKLAEGKAQRQKKSC